jgi:hypothetical protein
MMNHPTHEGDASAVLKAADIEPAVRQWAASVLHVDLGDADELTLGLRRADGGKQSARRDAARKRLLALLERIDETTRDVPDEEMEQAIAEAMQFVRSSPKT